MIERAQVRFVGPLSVCLPWIEWAKNRARLFVAAGRVVSKWYTPRADIRVQIETFSDRPPRILVMAEVLPGYSWFSLDRPHTAVLSGGVLRSRDGIGRPHKPSYVPHRARIEGENSWIHIDGLPVTAVMTTDDDEKQAVISLAGRGKYDVITREEGPSAVTSYGEDILYDAAYYDGVLIQAVGESETDFYFRATRHIKHDEEGAQPAVSVVVPKPSWLTTGRQRSRVLGGKWRFCPHEARAVAICTAKHETPSAITDAVTALFDDSEEPYSGSVLGRTFAQTEDMLAEFLYDDGIVEVVFTVGEEDGLLTCAGAIGRTTSQFASITHSYAGTGGPADFGTAHRDFLAVDYAFDEPLELRYIRQQAYISGTGSYEVQRREDTLISVVDEDDSYLFSNSVLVVRELTPDETQWKIGFRWGGADSSVFFTDECTIRISLGSNTQYTRDLSVYAEWYSVAAEGGFPGVKYREKLMYYGPLCEQGDDAPGTSIVDWDFSGAGYYANDRLYDGTPGPLGDVVLPQWIPAGPPPYPSFASQTVGLSVFPWEDFTSSGLGPYINQFPNRKGFLCVVSMIISDLRSDAYCMTRMMLKPDAIVDDPVSSVIKWITFVDKGFATEVVLNGEVIFTDDQGEESVPETSDISGGEYDYTHPLSFHRLASLTEFIAEHGGFSGMRKWLGQQEGARLAYWYPFSEGIFTTHPDGHYAAKIESTSQQMLGVIYDRFARGVGGTSSHYIGADGGYISQFYSNINVGNSDDVDVISWAAPDDVRIEDSHDSLIYIPDGDSAMGCWVIKTAPPEEAGP